MTKKTRRELTAEENERFDYWMQYWQRKLGLTDWRIERGSRKTNAMCDVLVKHVDHLATYVTGDWGSQPVDEDSLRMTAFHECCHVMLEDYYQTIALCEDGQADIRLAAEHGVILRLENLVKNMLHLED